MCIPEYDPMRKLLWQGVTRSQIRERIQSFLVHRDCERRSGRRSLDVLTDIPICVLSFFVFKAKAAFKKIRGFKFGSEKVVKVVLFANFLR